VRGQCPNSCARGVLLICRTYSQIGIDDALLSVQTAENVVEMNNGCICCTVRGDLVRSARAVCCPRGILPAG